MPLNRVLESQISPTVSSGDAAPQYSLYWLGSSANIHSCLTGPSRQKSPHELYSRHTKAEVSKTKDRQDMPDREGENIRIILNNLDLGDGSRSEYRKAHGRKREETAYCLQIPSQWGMAFRHGS